MYFIDFNFEKYYNKNAFQKFTRNYFDYLFMICFQVLFIYVVNKPIIYHFLRMEKLCMFKFLNKTLRRNKKKTDIIHRKISSIDEYKEALVIRRIHTV
jgi:hypothetical protein